MASITHDATASVSTAARPSLSFRLRLASRQFAAWAAERRLRRAVMRDLLDCEERDLRDLGISRSDFESIAAGTFKR